MYKREELRGGQGLGKGVILCVNISGALNFSCVLNMNKNGCFCLETLFHKLFIVCGRCQILSGHMI